LIQRRNELAREEEEFAQKLQSLKKSKKGSNTSDQQQSPVTVTVANVTDTAPVELEQPQNISSTQVEQQSEAIQTVSHKDVNNNVNPSLVEELKKQRRAERKKRLEEELRKEEELKKLAEAEWRTKTKESGDERRVISSEQKELLLSPSGHRRTRSSGDMTT